MTPMNYAVIAAVAAVGLIVLGLLYIVRLTGGDLVGYAKHIEAVADRMTQLLRELDKVHGGNRCPSKRRFRRNRCPDCAPKNAEMNGLVRSIPTPLLAIGAIAYYSRKLTAPVGRGLK